MEVEQIAGNDTTAFSEGCTAFLADQLKDASNVNCTFVNQTKIFGKSKDDIVARVTIGSSDSIDDAAALEKSAVVAINNNPGDFVNDLQNASDTELFANLTASSVSATAEVTAPPTKPDDAKEDDGGLSTWGIIGIVIAAIVLLAALIVIAMRCNGKKEEDGEANRELLHPEHEEVEEAEDEENIMIYPPADPLFIPPDAPKPNIASMFAVKAAASGAGSVLSGSVLSASSMAEEASEMEGYSVKAGGSTTVDNPGSVDVASAASGALSSLRHNMLARTVMIPPGKLGIVVDTTLEGPVVNRVNEASPVEGLLFPGDIIVAVDDVDTRAMSASAIYSLMKKTSDMRRKITVLSEDVAS
jgi:PDZ domain